MKTRKDKKNSRSILVCAVSIVLASGMMMGCSVLEPDSSETQTDNLISSEESANKESSGGELKDNLTVPVDQPQMQEAEESKPDNLQTSEENLSADAKEINDIAEKFAAAYFSGDLDTVKSCLTTPYEWDIEVYMGTETISNQTLKGLTDIGENEIGSIKVISLEYRNNEQDTFQYLTLEFVKQKDGWKIQFYGIEK